MLKEVLQVVGLGQCGCRLGYEFQKLGCDVSYCNSDEVDLRGMEVDKKNVLLLAGAGTGGSPTKGKEIVEENFTEFSNFISSRLDPHKMHLLIFGAGGGTGGSFIIPAVKLAIEKQVKTAVLATIPAKMLQLLAADNALRTLKELKNYTFNTLILADNEYLVNKIGLSSVWWQKVNSHIVESIASAFELLRPGKISNSGLGSIDKNEILRIMQSGKGATDIRTFYLSPHNMDEIEDKELAKKVFAPGLIEGYNYKTTLSYLISIDTPMKGDFTKYAQRVFNLSQKVCGSAISRLGMFTDPLLVDNIRITMVNSGMKLPKILQSRMHNLKRDEQRYMTKKEKEENITFSDLGESVVDEDFSF